LRRGTRIAFFGLTFFNFKDCLMIYRKLAALFLLSPLALAMQPANAAWTGYAGAVVGNFSVYSSGVAGIDQRYVYDQSAVTLQGSTMFSGIDGSGNAASMTFSYGGLAQATSTSLKASASASLANGFYNSENPAYMQGFTEWFSPIIDYSGVPTYLESGSAAFYQQRVAVSGTGNLAYITIDVKVDGTFSNSASDSVATWANLDFRNGSSFNLGDQAIDQSFNSGRIDVVNGVADVGIMLQTAVVFDLDHKPGFNEPLLEGAVDFSHTATITRLYGFDASGRAVDLASATTAGGQSYVTYRLDNVPVVPEPGSLALLACGLAVIAWKTRSTSKGR